MPSSKLVGLRDALDLVRNGDEITISGMTFFRNPVHFITSLIVSGKKDLSFVDREPGFGLDVLAASGVLKRIRAAMATFEHFGLAPSVRRAAESGEVTYIEDTCGAVIAGLRAGAQGVPFVPVRGIIGSDLVKLHESIGTWKLIEDPFTGEKVVAVRSIEPDVAIIHVQVSDEFGNALIMGPRYEDELKIRASKRVILTAERVVDTDELKSMLKSLGAQLSATSLYVTAVVKLSGGAWPTGVYGLYEPDYNAIREYYEYARMGKAMEWVRLNLAQRWS